MLMMDTEPDQQHQQPKQKRLSRKRWTPSLDKVLADLVVKQIQQGKRHDNGFDRKTWLNMRNEFNHQTGLNYNNNQLRKHLNVLRQRYDSFKSSQLHNQLVMEDAGCILGLDLWEDFGVQPRSEPVKVKDCPIYEQLCTIYGDVSSEGMYAQSSHFDGLDDESIPNHNTSENNVPTPNVERKRKREASSVSPSQIDPAVTETMAGALSDMVTSLRSRMGGLEREEEDDRFSITNCIETLDEMENVDEGVYFAALDLFESPCLRETFMSLKANKLRLTWLQVKCRKVTSSVAQLG